MSEATRTTVDASSGSTQPVDFDDSFREAETASVFPGLALSDHQQSCIRRKTSLGTITGNAVSHIGQLHTMRHVCLLLHVEYKISELLQAVFEGAIQSNPKDPQKHPNSNYLISISMPSKEYGWHKARVI